jgi:hypothetical protein
MEEMLRYWAEHYAVEQHLVQRHLLVTVPASRLSSMPCSMIKGTNDGDNTNGGGHLLERNNASTRYLSDSFVRHWKLHVL